MTILDNAAISIERGKPLAIPTAGGAPIQGRSSRPSLGRLTRHELREAWCSEAADFTPWLAQNLAILGEALGLELELEAQEKSVGPFRADILCRNLADDHWVLIENQLERTDHTHLGQLLTYASGLEAATIVWIAQCFTEEHRATLDWLNRISDGKFRFFGVEVELWRIGNSAAAPKFNIVAKPNDWSHSVRDFTNAIDKANLSEVRILQLSYWANLNKQLDALGGLVSGNRKPQPQSWMSFPIGRSGFHLNAVMIRPKDQIRAELFIVGEQAKTTMRRLKLQQEAIEQEFGAPLDWDEAPSRRDCRVACLLDADPEDETDWPRQHEWLANRLNDLHRVFARRVSVLDIGTADAEGEAP